MLKTVKTRWNTEVRVESSDLENKNKQTISIYNKNGIRICDQKTYKYSRDFPKSFIHKSNIINTEEWKAEQEIDLSKYPMVDTGEGAPQYTFDLAPETQLALF